MRWTVVIPVKALPAAKSRLLAASADPHAHARLVRALRADTANSARAASGVARVLFVTDSGADVPAAPRRPAGSDVSDGAQASTLVQRSPGLNGALSDAATHAASHWPREGVAALVGDLPALRPRHLAEALAAAAGVSAAFVSDTAGTGTTLLTATPGSVLRPSFGAGSAQRHAAWAQPLDAGDTLRADVDTAADLAAALRLGMGVHTTAALAARDDPLSAVHLDVG